MKAQLIRAGGKVIALKDRLVTPSVFIGCRFAQWRKPIAATDAIQFDANAGRRTAMRQIQNMSRQFTQIIIASIFCIQTNGYFVDII